MNTMRIAAALAALALLQAAPPAKAQDETADFWHFMAAEAENLTVASVTPETVFNSVSNVTVIDRAMIERNNFPSVSAALETLAGVTVLRTYLMHGIPTMRGALQEHYANKVLVMINNVPMWNAVTGEADLDRVGIDSVERIEVLRGPASVLYGSNALTGAINIVLRAPGPGEKPFGSVAGGLGSSAGGYGGLGVVSRASGLYAWQSGGASGTLAADSSNSSQPSVAFRDEDGTLNTVNEYLNARRLNFAGRLGAGSFLINASHSEQNYLGNTLTLGSGELGNEVREAALASYSLDMAAGPDLDFRYTAAYDWQRRNIPRDDKDDLRSDIVGARFVNSLTGRARLPGGFYLEGGAAYDYRYARRYLNYYSSTGRPQGDNSMNGRLAHENSGHLQLGLDSGPWKLLAGGRYTHNTAAGDNISSRVSAIYMFDERSSVKGMFSQAFRSPTPFEQYFNTSPATVLGNPGLKPEKTETVEVSYLASRGRFFGHLTAYRTRYTDTIFRNLGDFTRDGVMYSNVNHYDNAPGYSSEGLELECRYEGRATRAYLSLEHLRGSRGDERAVPAPGAFGLAGGSSWNFKHVPSHTVSAGISRDMGDFFAAAGLHGYGPNRSLRTGIGSQFWADLSAGYRKGGVRHTLSVRNLADRVVVYPEYVRQRVVESVPLLTGRVVEYTFEFRF